MGIYIGQNKYTGGPADPSSSMIAKSIGTTQGDMIYFTGASTPVRLPKGASGQVLTMNSGATAPIWATPSGGGEGGYSFKYDEFNTFDTTNQGYLKVTVSNTSSTEKLFTYAQVGSAYYEEIVQDQVQVLINITTNGTVSPGEHYLAISNQVSSGQNTLPLTVTPEMILINNAAPTFYAVSSSSGAWDDIPYGVTRLYSYIILNHNGSIIASPAVFITWCGDYNEI